ncbi:MAG: cupin domain-containing protein [Deltaproteobacteria bacterium]|nr:cupin domain-containing protein [Deltaproteobacteria bacterium]
MKIYDLAGRVFREGGETVLGLKDLGTHACYMLYGVLAEGDPARLLRPGPGHEEIILVMSGAMRLTAPDGEETRLQAGQAIYLQGEESRDAFTAGPGECRYVAAGGHSSEEGHGHGHGHDHGHGHSHDHQP